MVCLLLWDVLEPALVSKEACVAGDYYQFYRLGTGGFHKKAKPVRYVTQSQRGTY